VPSRRCGADRRRHVGTSVLLRFDQGESGFVPARRERDLGPGAARPVDNGLPDPAEAGTLIATGQVHLNGFEDLAYLTIYFPDRVIAHINVNWLSPVKVRTTLIGGTKRMLVWNDLEADEKVSI